GNVYKNTGDGWQQHSSSGWSNSSSASSWGDKESQARSTGDDRFGSGGGWGGGGFGGGDRFCGGGFGGGGRVWRGRIWRVRRRRRILRSLRGRWFRWLPRRRPSVKHCGPARPPARNCRASGCAAVRDGPPALNGGEPRR